MKKRIAQYFSKIDSGLFYQVLSIVCLLVGFYYMIQADTTQWNKHEGTEMIGRLIVYTKLKGDAAMYFIVGLMFWNSYQEWRWRKLNKAFTKIINSLGTDKKHTDRDSVA